MHRRLGGPLPHQLANAPQVHPCAEPFSSFNTESMPSLSLSGISFRFRKFSRSHGQVPYVLLTRSPLESRRTLVRLACIRHAASVHPEPGSNSPFDSTLFFQCLFADIFFFFLFVFLFRCFSRNRRVCFFSLALVRLIFCFFRFYQVFKDRPAVCFANSLFILLLFLPFVNPCFDFFNKFVVFERRFLNAHLSYRTPHQLSTTFYIFFKEI